jgi:CRP-like cAMP-binding protein
MQTHSATLLTIPGFAELTPIEAAALLHGAREMRVPAGKQIMGKGEPASTMVVLLAGRLRVSVASLLGRELTFRLVEPVDVVGEIAMLRAVSGRLHDIATGMERLALLDVRGRLADVLRHLARAEGIGHHAAMGADVQILAGRRGDAGERPQPPPDGALWAGGCLCVNRHHRF